jgi:hypothetical protein
MTPGLRPCLFGFAGIAAIAVAGCNQTSAPAPSTAFAAVTPPTTQLPAGAGCTGEIGRYQAVMENDRQSGNVNGGVYARVVAEIDRASAACAAGHDAEAVRMIAATKSRYGYR